MTKSDPLLLQFASTRPADVAALISNYTPGEINEFLAGLPGGVAARVCAHISSRVLFDVLEHMEPGIIGKLLLEGEHTNVLTLLSHLHQSMYPRILHAAKDMDHARLSQLFKFPEQTLAALASTDFVRVPAEALCGDVTNDLVNGDETTELPIFVVDSGGSYIGLAPTQTVIARRHKNRPVSKCMKAIEPLPGSMNAFSALNAPQWLTTTALAVVDSKRQIIGAITREELARVGKESAAGNQPGLEDLFSELSVRYLDLCANVVSFAFRNPKDPED